MLKKSRRITKSRDFAEIFSRGKGTRSNNLFLKAKQGNGPARFAVVVSKKVALKATQRNRIKRLLREALRENLLLIQENVDAVVVALPQFQLKNIVEAKEIVRGLLKKASLIK